MRQALKDQVWLSVAFDIAKLATCVRRRVGCVILDTHGRVMSTGYNGPAAGEPNCTTHRCPGADCPSGTGLELCEAVHAEANALLQCQDALRVGTVYCTDSPCVHCVKLLLNTSASRLVFVREYPSATSRELWTRSGNRSWERQELTLK